MITYFPHSTSLDNLSKTFSGWNDTKLSELGLRQASNLSKHVSEQQFDAVFCSDLKRAVQTASIAFPSIEIIRDARLREMNYGLMNGAAKSSFGGFEQFNSGFTNGENLLDVERRMRSFLAENYSSQQSIVIIAHRFPQLALEVIFNGKSWSQAFADDWRETGQWQAGWRYG